MEVRQRWYEQNVLLPGIFIICMLIIVGSTFLGWLTGIGIEMLAYGGGSMLFLPFLLYKDLENQPIQKKRGGCYWNCRKW